MGCDDKLSNAVAIVQTSNIRSAYRFLVTSRDNTIGVHLGSYAVFNLPVQLWHDRVEQKELRDYYCYKDEGSYF